MNTAIINENEYILNNSYLEPQNGKLHLYINANAEIIPQLQEDIKTGHIEIKYEENTLGTYDGYVRLCGLELRVDPEPQIYVILDVESPTAFINAIQNHLNTLDTNQQSTTQSLDALAQAVAELQEKIDSIEAELSRIDAVAL